jgi:hypothetical protein
MGEVDRAGRHWSADYFTINQGSVSYMLISIGYNFCATSLMPGRYCDGDSELLDFAWRTFGQTPTGWPRVQAICDFVHAHLRFD